LTMSMSRILRRYVFRAELGPGEGCKRRIEARRERCACVLRCPDQAEWFHMGTRSSGDFRSQYLTS
jgi:hypothetical protein